ncbi:unnamed protein product [Zymoseptoria tritici ST99CH_3D7]|uniref:Uncharacterized protein n=1 Tax=Zymoseptoria tritici (strain ST99CH_3D7) TaxID=1276538 RepID=A0A1X7RWH8_ZYMT9|nr:unnamed protein product [Zymoseptoria tritici ST99CH_3D7]
MSALADAKPFIAPLTYPIGPAQQNASLATRTRHCASLALASISYHYESSAVRSEIHERLYGRPFKSVPPQSAHTKVLPTVAARASKTR